MTEYEPLPPAVLVGQLLLAMADQEFGAEIALEAKPVWHEAARQWIDGLTRGVQFTADDLITDCGTPTTVGVNANNAIGAVFLSAKAKGLIGMTGVRTPSHRRSNHGRYIAVWQRL